MCVVYIAARYDDRLEMVEWANALKAMGHEVSSRWLDGSHDVANSDDDRERFAQEDYEDVAFSEVVLVNSPRSRFGTGRGGRHVEFGIALAARHKIILIGERENVFHWLRKRVDVVGSIDEALVMIEDFNDKKAKTSPISVSLGYSRRVR